MPFADTSVYKVPEGLTRRAGALPRRHPPDRLRGRRPERRRRARRHGRGRRRRPDRARRDHDGASSTRRAGSSRSTSPTRGSRRRSSSARTSTINNGREDAVAKVMELTDGLGADVAIEAVGVPETFELCTELIRPGGRVANVGVHGKSATLHLETLWIRDVTITTGLVDTSTTPEAAEADRGRQARPDAVRDAPLRARRDRGRRTTCSRPRPRRTRSRSCSRTAPVGSERGATAASRLPVGCLRRHDASEPILARRRPQPGYPTSGCGRRHLHDLPRGPEGGMPNGSRAPCTTSVGTVTASSSGSRLGAGAAPTVAAVVAGTRDRGRRSRRS